MKIERFDDKQIAKRVAGPGLAVKSGPFRFLIHSRIPAVAANLAVLYRDLLLDDDGGFFDFHIALRAPRRLKHRFTRQAQFYLDDQVIFNPFPAAHATAMLEWGMNWCISTQIHSYLIIHAAVVEKNGLAAILPAPPGSGKSTLCAGLVQEGWRLLSDELTLIDLDNARVVPMPRPIGLKNQSISIIKQRYPQAVFGVLSSDTAKGSVCHLRPPEDCVSRQTLTCPVGWIVFPKFEAEAATELQAKPKGQAFMDVANHAFNYSILGDRGFEVLKNVVDDAACFDFKYSRLDEAIETFAQLR